MLRAEWRWNVAEESSLRGDRSPLSKVSTQSTLDKRKTSQTCKCRKTCIIVCASRYNFENHNTNMVFDLQNDAEGQC